MSTETPETKNPYKLRREAVTRAVETWQRQAAEADEAGDREATAAENAEDLEDCLMNEGLILLPRSTGYGQWRVLVDGKPAPYPGQEAPSHPMEAEAAAEAFLTATAGDHYNQRKIAIRPASEAEMAASALIGDATVREESTRITAERYHLSREEATGRVELTISGEGGSVVLDLGNDGDEILVGLFDLDGQGEDDSEGSVA